MRAKPIFCLVRSAPLILSDGLKTLLKPSQTIFFFHIDANKQVLHDDSHKPGSNKKQSSLTRAFSYIAGKSIPLSFYS